MAVKSFKPITPARRQMTVPGFEEITKKTPEKSLITVKKKHAGRNNTGKITVRHHGGGNRIKYRIIDFKKNILDVEGVTTPITYVGDCSGERTASIAEAIRTGYKAANEI